ADRIVAHGEDTAGDAKALRYFGHEFGERHTGFQSARALHMERQVTITQLEPGLATELRQRLHEIPALVRPSPTLGTVCETAQRVEHGIDIGTDGEAKMFEIVARIDDDGQIFSKLLRQPECELRPADAATERNDAA